MTVPLQREFRCTQDGCPFRESGECLEQIQPLDECPHLEKLEPSVVSDKPPMGREGEQQKAPKTQAEPKPVSIYPGWPLQSREADAVMREAETTMVIVAGEADSGKTTLIALAYSAFLKGSVGEWRFAGSRTLLGFEACVQNHRVSEDSVAPFTLHTPTDVDEFYHLDVQSINDKRNRRLLLHNISGERYQQAMNTTSAAQSLHMVRRADVIVVMLDGRSLLKRASTSQAQSRMVDLLLGIAKVGHLGTNQPVQILISRWDEVVAKDGVAVVEAAMTQIRQLASKRLAEVGVSSLITIHGIASVTRHKGTSFGFGYPEVLQVWLSLRPKPVSPVTDEPSKSKRNEGWTSLGSNDPSSSVAAVGEQDV